MLWEEVERYTKLTGEDATHVPIIKLGAYLDGYEKGTEVLDNIRAEIIDTLYVDSLIFGELIDFKNGKISADDVIEEFNQVTRLEVLKIIDKYKAESEKV